jgi:hypothetical protein
MRPMAFSMPPFCQGLWLSQKKVLDAELGFELVMESELGGVVDGDGLAQLGGQGFEPDAQLQLSGGSRPSPGRRSF